MNCPQLCIRPQLLVAVEFDVASVKQLPTPEKERDLREMAIGADRVSDKEIGLAPLWHELVNGHARLVDVFFTEHRCYLVLGATKVRLALTGRRREILEAVLSGVGQKCVASDQGLAVSSIATQARTALEQLGLRCKASRPHPMLMLMASACSRQDESVRATLSFIETGAEQLRVIAAPRPDWGLARLLPPAELAAARLLIEGFSYQDMARLRKTSTRTIANQIAAVFRRLQVSGRNELVVRLFLAEAREQGPGLNQRPIQPKSAPSLQMNAHFA